MIFLSCKGSLKGQKEITGIGALAFAHQAVTLTERLDTRISVQQATV